MQAALAPRAAAPAAAPANMRRPAACLQARGAVSRPRQALAPAAPGRAALRRRGPLRCRADAAAAADRFEPQVCVVLGTQWGDEGKGKLVDILAQTYEVVARAQVRRVPGAGACASRQA